MVTAMVAAIVNTMVAAMVVAILVIILAITSLGHNYRNFLSYSSLIWEIIYTIRYPYIYWKFPIPWDNTSNFPDYTYIRDLV